MLGIPWIRKSSENSHPTANGTDADEEEGEEEPLSTAGVGVNWCLHVRLLEMYIQRALLMLSTRQNLEPLSRQSPGNVCEGLSTLA